MSKFKVGDRVRVTDPRLLRTGTPVGAIGTITEIGGRFAYFELEHPECGKIVQILYDAEEYLELLPATRATGTLTIREGRYYITRGGRKVGPMRRWNGETEHPWETDDDLPYIWADDGTEIDSDIDDSADLVAEADEPPVAEQRAGDIPLYDPRKDTGIVGSTAGFTVPLCAYDDEPGWYAAELGRAYADGYAAGLRAAA